MKLYQRKAKQRKSITENKNRLPILYNVQANCRETKRVT